MQSRDNAARGVELSPEIARQSRHYEALNETQRQVDDSPRAPSRTPQNYDQLRETHHEVDAEQRAAEAKAEPEPMRPVFRTWTSFADMKSQQQSANHWDGQNQEISRRKWEMENGQGGQDQQNSNAPEMSAEDKAEMEAARAAIDDAQRQEAAARARSQQQQHEPGRGR